MCNLLLLLASAAAALTLSRAAVISERTACTSVKHTGRLRVYENLAINPFSAMLQTEAYLGKASPSDPPTWVVPPTDGTEDMSTSTFHFTGCPGGDPFFVFCDNCESSLVLASLSTSADGNREIIDVSYNPHDISPSLPVSGCVAGFECGGWIWTADETSIYPNVGSGPIYATSDASHTFVYTTSATVPIPDANNVYYSLRWEED